jgi:hypothetical protein
VSLSAGLDVAGLCACGLQGVHVGETFIAQRVEVGDDDAGWGQVDQAAAQGSGARVAAVGRLSVVMSESTTGLIKSCPEMAGPPPSRGSCSRCAGRP